MVDSVIKVVKVTLRVLEAVWFYVRSITRKLFEEDILFLASGLAFNGILTMIPLLLLSASALGVFLNSSELGVQQVRDVLDTVFPDQPFATSIKESILGVVADIVVYRASLGIVGFLVLIWTATSLFDALRSVLHNVYRLPKTRTLSRSIMHSLVFVLLAFALFFASNLAIWVLSFVEQELARIPALSWIDISAYTKLLPGGAAFVMTLLMFYIVYRHIPDSRPPRISGIISTVTTTILWVVSARLFAFYLSSFSAIGKIYGPYAFILVLLVWIYYSSIIFIIGAIVGQVYWERLKLKEAGKLERWV
jgi:membrane protein